MRTTFLLRVDCQKQAVGVICLSFLSLPGPALQIEVHQLLHEEA